MANTGIHLWLIRFILGHGLKVVVAAMGLGTIAAVALPRVLRSMLFGITPTDTVMFALASATLIVIAVVAFSVPARRATKVDPWIALRNE